ncbi:MAG: N-acetyltransferase [Dehalococcoidia bacterium]|nr:MAG: N-acetyltransferase [Dehalococcoidia bacterium]
MTDLVRPEQRGDEEAIRAILLAAFPTAAEADLVDLLRAGGAATVSLVALRDGAIVGHILFSPAWIEGIDWRMDAVGLGPMAVAPSRQRQGIGSGLVEAGLAACRSLGHPVAGVLGYPAFYSRFGFQPATRFGVRCEFPAPAEAFLLRELRPRALAGAHGVFHYRPEFAQV